MFNGDKQRKTVLVDHGFRLPSAMDNRPLKYEEFHEMVNQCVYVSATPGKIELEQTGGEVVEQVIRPAGARGARVAAEAPGPAGAPRGPARARWSGPAARSSSR